MGHGKFSFSACVFFASRRTSRLFGRGRAFAHGTTAAEKRTKRNRLLADDKEKNVGMRAAVASLWASGHAEFARVRFPRPGMPPTWLKLPDSFGTGVRRLLAFALLHARSVGSLLPPCTTTRRRRRSQPRCLRALLLLLRRRRRHV